jgi:GTP cyclohydrolase II
MRGSMKRRSITKARVVARADLPTSFGRFRIFAIRGAHAADEAVAIVHGDLGGGGETRRAKAPLARVHSQCLTGDVFGSERCDCRAQLEFSLRKIAKEPAGIVLYLPQEGRGIGLVNKIRAYELQDAGLDTVEANRRLGFAADTRDYEFAAEALKALGVRAIRLLSNNPDKVRQLEKSGVPAADQRAFASLSAHQARQTRPPARRTLIFRATPTVVKTQSTGRSP